MIRIKSGLVAFLTLSLVGGACAPMGEIEGDEPPEQMDAATAMTAAALSGGARVFVPLAGRPNLLLSEAPLQALDANATGGTLERYDLRSNLFNQALRDYDWQYDSNGLRLLQLRFYEVPTTTVPAN
jgi:hypothetical protein